MPLSFDSNYSTEKNKIATSYPWLHLLEIAYGESLFIRIVNNNENVTFNGNTYTAFPFIIGERSESNSGKLNDLDVRVGNANRVLESVISQYNGLAGATATLLVVQANLLETYDTYAIVETYQIISSSTDNNWAYFKLGMPKLTSKSFPSVRYYKNVCNYTFKGLACKYTQSIIVTPPKYIEFTASTKNIQYTGGGFVNANFEAGDKILIEDSTDNNGTYTIDTVTDDNNIVVVESLADETTGDPVKISYFSCSKDFPACVKRNNNQRYGGYPSIPFGAIIKVKTNA